MEPIERKIKLDISAKTPDELKRKRNIIFELATKHHALHLLICRQLTEISSKGEPSEEYQLAIFHKNNEIEELQRSL